MAISRQDILDKIREVAEEPDLVESDPITDIGDSLDVVKVTLELELAYGIDIDNRELAALQGKTIADVITFVEKKVYDVGSPKDISTS